MSCNPIVVCEKPVSGHKIVLEPISWFDLRVFYVRVTNCEVDELTPDHLTVIHIPLTPDSIIEVNGKRASTNSDYVLSHLRRDRIDKRSEEATFISTDSVKMSGSVGFEVYCKDELLLVGVLETKNHGKKWGMKCKAMIQPGSGIVKGRVGVSSEMALPAIEVYVTGCYEGSPIILTKVVQPGFRKKHQMKVLLDSVPESETDEPMKEASPENASQLSEYRCYKPATDVGINCNSICKRAAYLEGEDGELSWFNAGVRVGIGISLGVCLGVGIGAGLLVRSYQSTMQNFKRRFM